MAEAARIRVAQGVRQGLWQPCKTSLYIVPMEAVPSVRSEDTRGDG